MMKAVVTDDDELITVYYGADVSEQDAQRLADSIAAQYPSCDTECLRGGQPLYYYLISVERRADESDQALRYQGHWPNPIGSLARSGHCLIARFVILPACAL
jgi:hypothetical protein